MFHFLKNNKSHKTNTNREQPVSSDWYLIDETHHSAYKLCQGAAFIGRDGCCQIQITDQFCSRRHARIDYGEKNCVITDLNTMNGLEVDGEFAGSGEQTLLEENSSIVIANTQFYITRKLPDKDMPVKDLSVYEAGGNASGHYYKPDYDPKAEKEKNLARSKKDDRTVVLSGKIGLEDSMYFESILPKK